MTIDTVLQHEIEWMQDLIDRIVANDPARQAPAARSPHETAAGPAGMLEIEALARAEALRQAPTAGDVLFGMLFLDTGDTILIGSRTITAANGEPAVIDWRAPVGARFFQSSVDDPHGVVVRRRVQCRGTLVEGVDDEHLMPEMLPPRPLVGEGALLADPVAADPTMAPVVATLRGDQDEAVRASRRGDTVVVGPPGTGKTVVALNRASYLDFVDRNHMFERNPVAYLVPTPSFAAYVAGVLPALGDASTRLAPMPQFLAEIAELVIGTDAASLARWLDGTDPVLLGSGQARRRWRAERLITATCQDRVIRSRNGLLVVGPGDAGRLIAESARGTWSVSRTRLRKALTEIAMRRHPNSHRDECRAAAAQVTNQILPTLSVAAIVSEITHQEYTVAKAHETKPPSSTALGALLMLSVEQGGTSALRRAVSEPQTPEGPTADLPSDSGIEFEWNGNSLAETLASSFAKTESFVDRQTDLWRGSVAANPLAHDHLIIDECQDQAPEVLRALRAAYPSAGRTLIGDLAQSGDPHWYQSVDDLLRAATSTRHTLHQLSHNYRNDHLIADHVNDLGMLIPGSLATIAVRPQPGELRLHPLDHPDVDTDSIVASARAVDAIPLWISSTPSPPPSGFVRSSDVKGHEFPSVVVVVDPASPPSESLNRSLYVAVSRARKRCDLYLPRSTIR